MKRVALLAIIVMLSVVWPLAAEQAEDIDHAFPIMAKQLAGAESRLPEKRIAIYGFDVIGRPGDSYAMYATEKLTHEIVVQGKFLVIERSRLDQLLKEQNFSLSGVVDSATAARIGKILSVDAVVAGSILVTEERTEFIVRVIQSETGMILASSDVYVISDTGKTKDKDQTSVQKDAPVLTIAKTRFSSSEEITVSWSGFPGNKTDWITLVPADQPDKSWGKWFYTEGKQSGSYILGQVAPGDYEIRAYFDWPSGGYVVRARVMLKVK